MSLATIPFFIQVLEDVKPFFYLLMMHLISESTHFEMFHSRPIMRMHFGTFLFLFELIIFYMVTFCSFAAALRDQKQVWVMNIVPIDSPDTLPIVYERGLFGMYHDWCESFSTYPRTYDLLHADHLFSKLKKRSVFSCLSEHSFFILASSFGLIKVR
jgi:hypothetical protein